MYAIRSYYVDVRFIEFMPMGGKTVWSPERFWSADEILADAEKLAALSPSYNFV